MSQQWIDTYSSLAAVEGLTHGFICRHPEVDVKTDRSMAIARLEPHFDECLEFLGVDRKCLAMCEQVHAAVVKLCGRNGPENTEFSKTDGLVTRALGQFLGVYVADCAAVFMVDPINQACGLVHSGKKGSELGITANAIAKMKECFGSRPEDLIVQVAPCIRPPDYEIDFAAKIADDCLAAGVPRSQFYDCGISTAQNLDRYYSYRIEKGETGRLLAVIGFTG